MCHGAGGLAAHYRFGARSGTAPLALGVALLAAALLPGGLGLALLAAMPAAALGALLMMAAGELGADQAAVRLQALLLAGDRRDARASPSGPILSGALWSVPAAEVVRLAAVRMLRRDDTVRARKREPGRSAMPGAPGAVVVRRGPRLQCPMRWPHPLIPGRLIRRYKRFLADVALADGGEVTVHCPNPGRMLGLDAPGARVWLSRRKSPLRKLPLTLELVEADGGLVGINTMHPNRLVEEAIRAGADRAARGLSARCGARSRYDAARGSICCCASPAVRIVMSRSRTYILGGRAGAEFPDCVTARGARHLRAPCAGRSARARVRCWCTWCSAPTARRSRWPRTSTRSTPWRPARRWRAGSRRCAWPARSAWTGSSWPCPCRSSRLSGSKR